MTAPGTQFPVCARDSVDVSGQASFVADFHRRQQLTWGSPQLFSEALGAKHTPYITIQGTTALVTVGDGKPYHPMTGGEDPNSVHLFTHIYVLDQNSNIVTLQSLDPIEADIASVDFAAPSDATSLTAYVFCNLHGLWQGPIVQVNSVAPEKGFSGEYEMFLMAGGGASVAFVCLCTICICLRMHVMNPVVCLQRGKPTMLGLVKHSHRRRDLIWPLTQFW